MAMSNVELYEALKGSIPDKAARLIAEVFPGARDLATKSDLADLRAEMRAGFAQLRILRWMLGLFLPVWLGTWATFVLIALRK